MGNCVSSTRIKVDPTKIEVISNLPVPKTPKDVKSFLGHASYYRRFIENFIKIASPLFKLLTKDNEFFWNISCQTAFETLKEKFFVAPILRGKIGPFHSIYLQMHLTQL